MSAKTVSDRLARAEARAPAPVMDPEPMTPEERMRAFRKLFYEGSLTMTPGGRVTIGAGLPVENAAEIAADLTAALQKAPDTWLILLTPAELRQALAAIDAGDWFMTWVIQGGRKVDFHPWPAWNLPRYAESAELARVVNLAIKVVARQAGREPGYDVRGELGQVRAWLAELAQVMGVEEETADYEEYYPAD